MIIGMIYRSLGVKPGDDPTGLLEGALDTILDSDELGRATGEWNPICATPAVLAIAARKINQTAIFAPKPAELVKACREARHTLVMAESRCSDWINDLQKADAVLLQFAHDEWERPYLISQCRPMLGRMLQLHYFANMDDATYAGEFQQLVEREKAKVEEGVVDGRTNKVAAS